MKSSSKILILAIFLVFICCVSAASAAEIDNVTESGDELAVEEIAADDVIDEQNTLASEEVDDSSENTVLASANEGSVDEKLSSGESSKVIYVGPNDNDGNGSYENPFRTFKLACDDVNGEKV